MEADDLTGCRLCLDFMKDPRQLPCFHSFCLCCLQKFDLSVGDELQCPICSNSIEIVSDDLSNLKVDHFISRLASKQENEECYTDRFCEHHPSAKINFFCVDCEVTGCPICSTGKHDGHRCIDLNEMGSVIRDEMKNMSRGLKVNLSRMNVEMCKEKQLEAERQKIFEEVSSQIKERGDMVRAAIDKQVENLLKQVEAVRRRCSRNNESLKKRSKNLMENVIQSFITYMDRLYIQGTSEELIESVRDIKARSDYLKQVRIDNWNSEKMSVNFIPSDLHVDTLSLVGHVEILKVQGSKHQDRTDAGKNISNTHPTDDVQNDEELRNDQASFHQNQKGKGNLISRKIPEVISQHSINIGRNVAAIAVGKKELFVAVEHTGDILRFELENFIQKSPEIKVDGLETPWDVTAINNDELSTTYLFVIDNLHGKIFQVNVPHNSNIHPLKFVRKVWNVGLSESATLSAMDDRLLVVSTANKIIEYSLSSLLITSLSSTSILTLPPPVSSISVIPNMTDILHASRVSNDKFVAFFDHLYSFSGGFLVNSWGKMIYSFGEGRGKVPHCQIDYPSHVAVDMRKAVSNGFTTSIDSDPVTCEIVKAGRNMNDEDYNDEAFIFLCDNGNDRISLFDADLKFLKLFVEKVDEPWRICVDSHKNLLFVSTLQQTVQVYRY